MNIVYFDLETQNTFDEVGGRNNIAALKACLRSHLVNRPE